ncbi:hypothetical protein DFP72DRAFT_575251 [Ephemerocybe angulata]|uniref:Uncharacterized protein n=1 Tax=Ephemerocybe angulata TaxID=980116 RepID=A0A8H6M1N0_9AGAR|nr:hypothetical protein DFP72DRAFT_575251 [Tulosesus angulatus]
MASAFAALNRIFHKPRSSQPTQMLDDDQALELAANDFEPYFPTQLYPDHLEYPTASDFITWSPPTHPRQQQQILIPDATATPATSSPSSLTSQSTQGTATRAHPRPQAQPVHSAAPSRRNTQQMPPYRQQMHQQLPALVTQPAGQPVVFDLDLEEQWNHQGGSASAAQFEAQQQQPSYAALNLNLNLNLANPSLSPASSFSSLSPSQVPLPLTPGIAGVPTMAQQLQHPGPPLTPSELSTMSNGSSTPSASSSLPNRSSGYSFQAASPYLTHESLRRASVAAGMPPSPSSPSSPYQHQHQHQRNASAPGYHPYANNGRYQPQQQHRRSPLHQQQNSRASPLGQAGYAGIVAEDFVGGATDAYTAQFEKMRQGQVVQGGYPMQQQGYFEQQQRQFYPSSAPQESQQQRSQRTLARRLATGTGRAPLLHRHRLRPMLRPIHPTLRIRARLLRMALARRSLLAPLLRPSPRALLSPARTLPGIWTTTPTTRSCSAI